MELFRKIWHPVDDNDLSNHEGRYVIFSNRIALLIVAAGWTFLVLHALMNRSSAGRNMPVILPFTVLLFIPVLNYKNKHASGRIVLAFFFPLYLLASGIYQNQVSETNNYDPRVPLLLCSVIPFLLFSARNRVLLIVSLLPGVCSIFAFFPLVGIFRGGFTSQVNHYFLTSYDIVLGLTYLLIALMSLSFKNLQEKAENLLALRTTELEKYHSEALTRNEEIAGMLTRSEGRFAKSHLIIAEQNTRLNNLNRNLEQTVREKTTELRNTNAELVKYNNELLQFSFTISHNLRGPVARLLGLTNLMDMNGGSREIYDHIKTTSHELEYVLRDLSQIVDMRNEMYRIREKVSFEEEWRNFRHNFMAQLEPRDLIETDFTEAPWIISMRPMVSSIFYNLVSNAIMYRTYDKGLRISIETLREGEFVLLRVSDNGMGINLDEHGKNMFKLYKRFHLHKEGKGIGLYLVKTQAEILGGRVSVVSQAGKGSEFTVYFKVTNERNAQLCMSDPAASIYYHAWLTTLEFKWHGQPSLIELEEVFEKGKQVMKNHKAVYLISDVRDRAEVTRPEQRYAMEKIIPTMFQAGIQKMYFIQHADKLVSASPDVLKVISKESRFAVVNTTEEAMELIESNL